MIHKRPAPYNLSRIRNHRKKIENYVSSHPSKGLILIAEVGPKLLEACEMFGDPEGVECWYNETKKSIEELTKWGDANPDLKEYLEFFHHLGHFENNRWLDNKNIEVLKMRGRIAIRNNKLRDAERNLENMLCMSRKNNLADEDRLLWLEFKLIRLKKLRKGFQNFEPL